MKVVAIVKKHPWILLAVGIVALVVFEVYKSTSGKLAASGVSSAGTPGLTAAGGASSQLGGYVLYNEEVINPTPVTINFNGKPRASRSHPSPASHSSPASPAKKSVKVVKANLTMHQPPIHNSKIVKR